MLKVLVKEGFALNQDSKVVGSVIKAVLRNRGECPCHNESIDKNCPCSDYLNKDICHCGLYEKLNRN